MLVRSRVEHGGGPQAGGEGGRSEKRRRFSFFTRDRRGGVGIIRRNQFRDRMTRERERGFGLDFRKDYDNVRAVAFRRERDGRRFFAGRRKI